MNHVNCRRKKNEPNRLKDPILQRGFEIICKENAELKGLRCCENCKNVNLQLHWRESEEIDKRRQFVCGTCGNHKHWEYLGKTVGITETQQLTKAKEIIKKFSEFANNEIEYDPEHPQEHTDLWNKLCEQAEQFLKEIDK